MSSKPISSNSDLKELVVKDGANNAEMLKAIRVHWPEATGAYWTTFYAVMVIRNKSGEVVFEGKPTFG